MNFSACLGGLGGEGGEGGGLQTGASWGESDTSWEAGAGLGPRLCCLLGGGGAGPTWEGVAVMAEMAAGCMQ